MQKMIIIDLDDTLLNDNKEITNKNKEVIQKLKELGHIIVIATGRAFHGAIDYYNELGLNTLMISDNGALVSNPSDESFKIIRKTISNNDLIPLLNNTIETIATGSINQDSIVYGYNYHEIFDLSFNGIKPKKVIEIDYLKLDFEPMNIDVAVYKDKSNKFEAFFTNHKTLAARYWGGDNTYGYYDIHLKAVSKASAILNVMSYYNISIDNLITFGDGVNDTEMLALSPNGNAMKNAKASVKAYANFITEFDHNNSGVGLQLEKLFKL